MEIRAGSEWITLVEDRESGSSRHSIYCSLYPLAEWVAYNWWFLRADARPSGRLAQYGGLGVRIVRALPRAQRDRHSIRASGDGFAWPELLIVPDGDLTRLVWESDWPSSPNWPVRFLTWGDCRVDSESVQHELALLVSSVLTRLDEEGISGTALEKEWAAIQQADPQEADYCLAAARLGLDPYSEAAEYERGILSAGESLSGRLLMDFLDAVSPSHLQTALGWISALRPVDWPAVPSEAAAPDADAVLPLRAEARAEGGSPSALPWETGWRHAHHVRNRIGPGPTARFDVDRYVSRVTQPVADRGLHALGNGRDQSRPLVFVGRPGRDTSIRFTLSRSLWHLIWDDDPVFLVTGAYTDRQKTERAFAAELLAPAMGIAERLESEPGAVSDEELDQMADHFGVSPRVIDHQIRNQLLAAG